MNQKANKELQVMLEISNTFQNLEPDSVARIVKWLSSVFNEENTKSNKQLSLFDLSSFYSEKNPQTDKEKALVISYWLQEHEKLKDIDALTVNRRLEELGAKKIQNITRAYHSLQNNTPPLAEQTSKSSSKKLGRKYYHITTAGKKYINEMINTTIH